MFHRFPARSTVRVAAGAAGLALLVACGGGDDRAADTPIVTTSTTAGGDTTQTAVTDASGTLVVAPTNASLADPNTTAQLDSVAAAAQSGLTQLSPMVAIPLVQSFETKLRNANDPALTAIAEDLEDLRDELDDAQVNGREVGDVLERLGPKVTAVAARGGAVGATLRTLGTQLSSAGRQLKGGR
jgi:hypothetical protein